MALPPPSRQAEARAIEEIFQDAFTAIGLKAAIETLDLWEDVPSSPSAVPRATAAWLSKVLRVVGLRRDHARKIAMSYYRLSRALWTGYTVQDPEESGEETVALDDLRQDFYHQVESLTPDAIEERPKASSEPGDDKIKVEVIKDLESALKNLDEALEEIASTNLNSSGSRAYERKLRDIDIEAPAREVDDIRERLRTETGAKQAAIAQKSALDSARSAIHEIAKRDDRVLGYVRVSRTGTPCYWCAMLISRGLILYSSARSAQVRADGEEFHTNCQCYAVPVYSEEQFETSPVFALNRKYDKLWGSVTEGFRGKEAERVWRRYFRNHPSEVSGAPGARPD